MTGHTGMCRHSVADPANSLIVESHWSAASRVRCTACGGTADIGKKGGITPSTCDCHAFKSDEEKTS